MHWWTCSRMLQLFGALTSMRVALDYADVIDKNARAVKDSELLNVASLPVQCCACVLKHSAAPHFLVLRRTVMTISALLEAPFGVRGGPGAAGKH